MLGRHERTITRARLAVAELDRTGQPVTVASVARAAQVSRSWLYAQPELRATVIRLRSLTAATAPTGNPVVQRATADSLRQRLDATRQELHRLRVENAELRDRLAHVLGQQRQHH